MKPTNQPQLRTIADRLKHAMEVRGMSGRQVDRVVYGRDSASGWVSMILREKKGVSIDGVEKAAAALNVQAGWLAWGKGQMDIPAEGDEGILVSSLRGSIDGGGNHQFDIAIAYHRAQISDEAIRRVRNKMPSATLSASDLGEMLLDAQREVTAEASARHRKRKASDEAERATPPPPAIELERKGAKRKRSA